MRSYRSRASALNEDSLSILDGSPLIAWPSRYDVCEANVVNTICGLETPADVLGWSSTI